MFLNFGPEYFWVVHKMVIKGNIPLQILLPEHNFSLPAPWLIHTKKQGPGLPPHFDNTPPNEKDPTESPDPPAKDHTKPGLRIPRVPCDHFIDECLGHADQHWVCDQLWGGLVGQREVGGKGLGERQG
jgi:hypothetical protein